jgi:hypothetical protein
MNLYALYDHCRQDINIVELKEYFNAKGMKDAYNFANMDFNSKLAAEINPIEFNEVCQTWDIEETITNLNAMITFALNEYKNK